MLGFAFVALAAQAKEKPKVNKERSHSGLTGGYSSVNETKVYDYDEITHERVLIEINLICQGRGEMRCKSQSVAVQQEFQDFDLTPAEKLVAQNLLNAVESQLDAGNANGNLNEVHTFMNPEGVAYSRTFIGTWTTNADGKEVYSVEVGDVVIIN